MTPDETFGLTGSGVNIQGGVGGMCFPSQMFNAIPAVGLGLVEGLIRAGEQMLADLLMPGLTQHGQGLTDPDGDRQADFRAVIHLHRASGHLQAYALRQQQCLVEGGLRQQQGEFLSAVAGGYVAGP